MAEKNKTRRTTSDGTKIRIASRDKVVAYRYELEEILKIIGHSAAFITDRSATADFFDSDDDEAMTEVLQEIRDHFGISAPTPDEFLVDIAERARAGRKGQ